MTITSSETRTIDTRLGPVIAAVQDGLLHAKGIRFGTAKRFHEPEPIAAWSEPIDCTQRAAICPQLPFDFDFILGNISTKRLQHEDCLTASVACPVTALDGLPLPVLFWIHGGANISGGADMDVFDTSELAQRGVVVVSIQYRLGLFGAVPIEGVAPANLCLLDQILALKWVNANIDRFGGDPSRITIMGQSAGAAAVYSILLSDMADGLYNKAVIISAPLGVPQAKTQFRKELSDLTNSLMGPDPHSLSTADILKAQERIIKEAGKRGNSFAAFAPLLGAYPLPPSDKVQARLSFIAPRIELLTGWAADDCLPFVYMVPAARRLLHLPILGRWLLVLIGKIATHLIFKSKSKYLHLSFLAAGGKSTTFCVEWFPEGGKWRACHCIEMPLMFGKWDLWKNAPLCIGKRTGPADREHVRVVVESLGGELKNLFTGFAKGTLGLRSGSHLSIDEGFALAKL